ncbi:MAG: hypothetical protein MK132_23520 [Lentisphaerales bacterium]|nr:hypothetical protein [Lentisphaerales bacterium]
MCYLLFFVNVHTRKVIFGGATYNPNEEWVCNVACDLSGLDEDLENAELLIHDNDTIFTKSFNVLFKYNQTKVIKTAYMTPNMKCQRRALDKDD